MDWSKVESVLREKAVILQKEQANVPASAVASNAAIGAAAMVLGALANAIAAGRSADQ